MIHDRYFDSCEYFIQIALKSPYPANTSSTDCGGKLHVFTLYSTYVDSIQVKELLLCQFINR